MKRLLAALAVPVLLLTACSSGDESEDAASDPTTTTSSTADSGDGDTADPQEPITVLVTNDDGIAAPGIDALVTALDARDDVQVVVVAPAENQSGSGGKTTAGELQTSPATTASGYEATSVVGFPADSVIWALGEGEIEPDLVISGINSGQNIGPLVNLSGTVGAARQAAQLGVPSVAVSQGFGDPPDFPTTVEAILAWLDDNIDSVRDGSIGTDTVTNVNAPTCPTGEVQGVVEVPVAGDTGADLNAVDCGGTADPTDDVTAFTNGWIAISALEPTGSNTE